MVGLRSKTIHRVSADIAMGPAQAKNLEKKWFSEHIDVPSLYRGMSALLRVVTNFDVATGQALWPSYN